jgi:hypothetical protein
MLPQWQTEPQTPSSSADIPPSLHTTYRGYLSQAHTHLSENFIAEKNLAHAPFEFGYALGVSRPLAMAASPERCNLCLENVQVGAELYGGLGTHERFGFAGTSQYFAPTVSLQLANGTTFKVSPGFGLTNTSAPFLLRFGVSYEISQFGRTAGRLFR